MVNKVILIGNVGVDPEMRTLENGVKVARLRLATTERMFDRQTNQTREHTEWHTVTLWRGLADVVDRYVHKGSQIYIEGRIRTREWMDKDNNKRYSTEILADSMNLLGRRSDNPDNGGYAGNQQYGGGQQMGGQQYGGQPAGGYGGQTQTPGYGGQTSTPGYGGAASVPAQSQPAPAPAPAQPMDDPDDLPF